MSLKPFDEAMKRTEPYTPVAVMDLLLVIEDVDTSV